MPASRVLLRRQWTEGSCKRPAGDRRARRPCPSERSRTVDNKRYVMAVGTDDAGVNLRDFIKDKLQNDPRVKEVRDFGVADASDKTAYPIICIKVAEAVARGEVDRAVLFGGTGLGEAISANKVRGVRAAVAYDAYSIERSVLSNNCQVLCLGERVIVPMLADRVVQQWLGYEFDASSPSARKVSLITDYEEGGLQL